MKIITKLESVFTFDSDGNANFNDKKISELVDIDSPKGASVPLVPLQLILTTLLNLSLHCNEYNSILLENNSIIKNNLLIMLLSTGSWQDVGRAYA